jgi:hypothetical protein
MFKHAALGDIAHFRAHARIAEIVAARHVEQHQFGNRLRRAVRVFQRAPSEQFACETLAEKTCAAGNQYFHDRASMLVSESRSDTA